MLNAISQAGLLAPVRLAELSDEDLTEVIQHAAKEAVGDASDGGAAGELLAWLILQRNAAIQRRKVEEPREAREWYINRYAVRLEAEKRAREVDAAAELQRHEARKVFKPPPDLVAASLGTRGRHLGSERLSKDEEARRGWASKAMEIMARSGWLGSPGGLGVGEEERIRTRLLRGLRMRTLRQRVHSLERMQRWCTATLQRPWFSCIGEVEDFMAEQASIPDFGVSCYERCRLALI